MAFFSKCSCMKTIIVKMFLIIFFWHSACISYTNISTLPDPFIVRDSLIANHSQLKDISNSLIVGADLNIGHTNVFQLPDRFIVPGTLFIDGCPIHELLKGIVAGAGMYIRDTDISTIPESAIVNEPIYADFDTDDAKGIGFCRYEDGRYLFADGILTHIKRKKRIGKYDYYIGKIPGVNVVSDGTYYAHCENIREGIRDLEFKHAKDRDAEQYHGIDTDKAIPTAKMIEMYRVITGACWQGTDAFLRSLGKLKDSYTVREAIELTDGQYGAATFKNFFE